MHISFDYDENKQMPQCNWPQYFKNFDGEDFEANSSFELNYQIYAQRNYKYFTENGKRFPIPQVKPEGSLKLRSIKDSNSSNSKSHLSLSVEHIREWAIWTESPKSSKQIINADINFADDAYGTLKYWNYKYKTTPILPKRFYKFDSLPLVQRNGKIDGDSIIISDLKGKTTVKYQSDFPTTTLYTLIERIQSNKLSSTDSINLLDDLTMMRARLNIIPLKERIIHTKNGQFKLGGFALAGLSSLPLYFWKDAASRVIAILGHNVAYILNDSGNLQIR